MSLELYDKALLKRLKDVYPNVIYAQDEQALVRSAETEKARNTVELPLISFYRLNATFAMDTFGNDMHTRLGAFTPGDDFRLKAFPVDIFYQIDIWSDRRVEVDGIWRELIQHFYTKPNLILKFPELDEELNFAMYLMDTDNATDISSFSDKNRLYRTTISVEVRQAKLFFKKGVHLAETIPVRVVSLDE